jgi:hypothetical protein
VGVAPARNTFSAWSSVAHRAARSNVRAKLGVMYPAWRCSIARCSMFMKGFLGYWEAEFIDYGQGFCDPLRRLAVQHAPLT